MSLYPWIVTRDDVKVFGPGSYDDCYEYIHKASSGASVDWLCKYEGYAIVPESHRPGMKYRIELNGEVIFGPDTAYACLDHLHRQGASEEYFSAHGHHIVGVL